MKICAGGVDMDEVIARLGLSKAPKPFPESIKYAADIDPSEEKNLDLFKAKEKTAFVITTRFTGREAFEFTFKKNNEDVNIREFPDIISSVERIKKYYPNNQIIVVDSASPNKEYQSIIKAIDSSIIIEDIDNKNYEAGGIIYAFKKYKNCFDSFLFLQDSFLLEKEKIKEINNINDEFYYNFLECRCGWCHRSDFDQKTRKWILDEESDFIIRDSSVFRDGIQNPIYVGPNISRKLDKDITASYKEPFNIAYCCSFLTSSRNFEKVLATNIIDICPLPVDKIGSCSWERIFALAFAQAGIKDNFLDGLRIIYWFGNCAGGKGANYTTKFIKFYLGRS